MERSLLNASHWRRLLLSASLLTPGVVFAADNGIYVGLASSDVSSDYDVGQFASAEPVDDDRGFKAIVGFRPLDSFAIEANYADLGDTRVPLDVVCIVGTPCPNETSIDSRAVSVSAVGLFALPLVDLYGRVGVARWESEQTAFAQQREGTDPTYGAGAQVRVGSFALRIEYERFDFDDDSADLVSVGFTYTFL